MGVAQGDQIHSNAQLPPSPGCDNDPLPCFAARAPRTPTHRLNPTARRGNAMGGFTRSTPRDELEATDGEGAGSNFLTFHKRFSTEATKKATLDDDDPYTAATFAETDVEADPQSSGGAAGDEEEGQAHHKGHRKKKHRHHHEGQQGPEEGGAGTGATPDDTATSTAIVPVTSAGAGGEEGGGGEGPGPQKYKRAGASHKGTSQGPPGTMTTAELLKLKEEREAKMEEARIKGSWEYQALAILESTFFITIVVAFVLADLIVSTGGDPSRSVLTFQYFVTAFFMTELSMRIYCYNSIYDLYTFM